MRITWKLADRRPARPCDLCGRKRTVQRIWSIQPISQLVAARIQMCGVCALDIARTILEGWVKKPRRKEGGE